MNDIQFSAEEFSAIDMRSYFHFVRKKLLKVYRSDGSGCETATYVLIASAVLTV